ncbi:DUF1049 domain-containing protein [Sporolactobacillus shoreae]|uniref:DUF1049 domain-containing protein n=1 Tax=Sporolactobacillus shoreae TaxID=1465501 RepID=A0A4Z0GRN6_9BACL|nr:lipopolysaccharide assembly protein LapA domain-containing protein [Sporolactobacillus shoreae]TGA99511.1 DUF1049 domain-containing protein [Sporolactobacillus shoreae]
MRKQWNILMVLIFILVIVLLSISNADSVTISFLFGEASLPKILVIIVSVLIGALLVGSFTYLKIYRQQHRIRQMEKELHRIAELHPEDASRISVTNTTGGDEAETRTSSRRSFFKK